MSKIILHFVYFLSISSGRNLTVKLGLNSVEKKNRQNLSSSLKLSNLGQHFVLVFLSNIPNTNVLTSDRNESFNKNKHS